MVRLVRKNLIVDADALRELARERGTSESEAVRDAVTLALGAQEMITALTGLHEIGAFADYEQVYTWPEVEQTKGHVAEPGADSFSVES